MRNSLVLVLLAACGGGDGGGTKTDGGNRSGMPSHDLGSCTIFPSATGSIDDYTYWNKDISGDPVDALSDSYIASIGTTTHVHPDFGSDPTFGIPFDTVPGDQPKLQMDFDVPDESDPGPYPFPPDAPVESDSDAHVLVVDRDNCVLYEVGNAQYHSDTNHWSGFSGAKFDLKTGTPLRTDQFTSADASGGPILVGLARVEEVQAGAINHALRFTASTTQKAFVHPATHAAGSTTSTDVPPMGLRLRLKASECPALIAGAGTQSKVIVQALCTYGMILTDNGSNYFISGSTDPRWDDNDLDYMKSIPGSDFEVVQSGPLVPET